MQPCTHGPSKSPGTVGHLKAPEDLSVLDLPSFICPWRHPLLGGRAVLVTRASSTHALGLGLPSGRTESWDGLVMELVARLRDSSLGIRFLGNSPLSSPTSVYGPLDFTATVVPGMLQSWGKRRWVGPQASATLAVPESSPPSSSRKTACLSLLICLLLGPSLWTVSTRLRSASSEGQEHPRPRSRGWQRRVPSLRQTWAPPSAQEMLGNGTQCSRGTGWCPVVPGSHLALGRVPASSAQGFFPSLPTPNFSIPFSEGRRVTTPVHHLQGPLRWLVHWCLPRLLTGARGPRDSS